MKEKCNMTISSYSLNITETTKRKHWVDVAKGILILFLLVHHFGSAIKHTNINGADFLYVYRWQIIFTPYFMQTFFFLSGYCSNFSKPLPLFVKGLFQQLILPFVFFECLICFAFCPYERTFSNILDFWISSNGTHLWFLNALIISKMLIYSLNIVLRRDKYLIITSVFLLIISVILDDYDLGTNFFCVRQSLGSVLFVALGFFIKKRPYLLDRLRYIGCLFPIVIILLKIIGINVPVFTATMGITLKNLPLFLITSISGTLFL